MEEDKKSNLDNQENNNKPQEPDLEKYKDQGGVTLKKLNFGLWFIEHRRELRIVFISFLVIFSAVFLTYGIYGFANYIARGMAEDDILIQQIEQSTLIGHDYILQISPRDLQIAPVKALKAIDKRYDFLVQIKSVNEKHLGEFEYHFLVGGKEVGHAEGFIMPGESKYILSLANEFNSAPTNVKLVIDNMIWNRINQHDINDWDSYQEDRLDITISDAEFLSAKTSGLSEKINLNSLEFNTTNNTAYSYWNVDFVILLKSNSRVVGVNKYSLPEFMSTEKRTIEISWPGILSRVNKIDIFPEINIIKDDIYIRYTGE